MANRTPGSMPPLTPEAILSAAMEEISNLRARIARLEAQGGQQLPGDFRFEPSEDGASVLIRRVSTDETQTVAGPL